MSERSFKWTAILLGLLMLIFLGSIVSSSSPAVPTCKSDWTKCTDNADMANHYSGWFDAQYTCKVEATKLARFGEPEWPRVFFFADFYPGTNYSTGIVTLIEPRAKFQNGFGAMAHSRVICIYDLHSKKAISIDIS